MIVDREIEIMNMQLLLKKANSGDFVSQEKLAWIYYKGTGVKKSYKRAFYWYLKSTKHGNPIVYYNLGLCYLLGQGTKTNYKRAFHWTKKAAEAGYADGMLALGWHYHNGFGTKQNYVLATKWYRQALKEKECGSAYFSLGQIAYGNNNFDLAAKYFSDAVSKFNHPRSSYYLGRMYLEGKSVPKDQLRSKQLLEEASIHGIYQAKRLLNSKKIRNIAPFYQQDL